LGKLHSEISEATVFNRVGPKDAVATRHEQIDRLTRFPGHMRSVIHFRLLTDPHGFRAL
jgi:hypothetical protein